MAIILAAGEGKRMKSKNSKVVNEVCGKSIIQRAYEAVAGAGINDCVVVVGHRQDQVMEVLGEKVKYAIQDEQLGTGHAVMKVNPYMKGRRGKVIVLYGDMPLLTSETFINTLKINEQRKDNATIITAIFDDPTGYGRITRDKMGNVSGIVEHKDATEEQKLIKEINSGLYCFDVEHLVDALHNIKNDNTQKEYYLTDAIKIMLSKGLKVGTVSVTDNNEVMGINDRVQLYEASEVLRKKNLVNHMKNGVTILDMNTTIIEDKVEIGRDTIIYPNTILQSGTKIGEDCTIGPDSRIVASTIENGAVIQNSVVLESIVGANTHVGPFAYIRPGSKIGKDVKIGDFVEVKNSTIGDKTKAAHLTYIGDADVGSGVNFGCGTVIGNYDGKKKYRTTIEDNAFIGCNTNLLAPVTVKKNAYTAAGSTITETVPENSLAIARARQVNKEDWVTKKGMKKE